MLNALQSKLPLYPFVRARSALYTVESLMGPLIELAMNRRRPRLPIDDPELFNNARAALEQVLKQDVENIRAGIYPLDVLAVENPLQHLRRLPRMFFEGVRIARRRNEKKSKEFSPRARDLMNELPEYYRRNFHFQGDGYLSAESAELYDHQVDILFAGTADAMRRLLLPSLRERFGNSDGEGLKFLEIGSGTGRATLFTRLAFPRAKIVSLDLSAPYLKKSQTLLRSYSRHDFVEGDAAALPFLEDSFDAVYSVFLFHELPREVRGTVLREAARVLKPDGFFGFVDSLQLGDVPKFDEALKTFPVQFHEPFYRNYIETPMEQLIGEAGFKVEKTGSGFFSKFVTSHLK